MPIRSPSGRRRQRASFSSTARWIAGSYICPGTAAQYTEGAPTLWLSSALSMHSVASNPRRPLGLRRAKVRPRRSLAAQVQPHPEQTGALLHRVSRRAFQVEAQVQRRARAARTPDLLRPELLARDALAIHFGHDLAQRPRFVSLRIDVVAQDPETPPAHAEHLVQATRHLLAGHVRQLDTATDVGEGHVKGGRQAVVQLEHVFYSVARTGEGC